jgi:hypothetical protein
MTFNYPGNASLVGPGIQSSRVGVHNLDYGFVNPYVDSGSFPVANPVLQWNFDMASNGTSLNTGYSSSITFVTAPYSSETTRWKHSAVTNATAFGYTKSGGSTGLYLELPVGSNLSTVDTSGIATNSYDGTTIRSNMGYTLWTCTRSPGTYNEFHRVLMYAGSGDNNSSVDVNSQTNQYANITIFNYTTTSTATTGYGSEFRFGTPSGNTSNSSYQKHAQDTTGTFSPGHIMISIWVFNPSTWDVVTTSASIRSKVGVYSTSTSAWYISPTTSFSSNFSDYGVAAGVRSGTTGRPLISDSLYGHSGRINLIAAGFANRPYSSSEIDSLFTWLAARHLNVVA